jgi:hypothetical protein
MIPQMLLFFILFSWLNTADRRYKIFLFVTGRSHFWNLVWKLCCILVENFVIFLSQFKQILREYIKLDHHFFQNPFQLRINKSTIWCYMMQGVEKEWLNIPWIIQPDLRCRKHFTWNLTKKGFLQISVQLR